MFILVKLFECYVYLMVCKRFFFTFHSSHRFVFNFKHLCSMSIITLKGVFQRKYENNVLKYKKKINYFANNVNLPVLNETDRNLAFRKDEFICVHAGSTMAVKARLRLHQSSRAPCVGRTAVWLN